MKVTFSNPRLRAEFDDWPIGRGRVRCVFAVERDAKKGWRVSRTTTGKPKFTTWGGQACVVDGSDGRTYVLQVAAPYGFVKVYRHDFLDATGEIGRDAAVFPDGADAGLHKGLLALILQGGALAQAVNQC